MTKLETERVVGHVISKGKNEYVLRICLCGNGHARLDSNPLEYDQIISLAHEILKPQGIIEESNRENNWDLRMYDEKMFKHLHFRGDIP